MGWCERAASSLNVEEDGALICAIYDPTQLTSSQYLYFRMMKLNGNEFNLNGGRFKSFRFEAQKYRIVLAKEAIGPVQAWSTAIIAWIGLNIESTWSMKGVAIENSGVDLEFSFANAVAAVHFALRWR